MLDDYVYKRISSEGIEPTFVWLTIPSTIELTLIRSGDEYGVRTRESRRERALC